MPQSHTTVKVSRATRDRLMERARAHGSTAEQTLVDLLDEAQWRDRMERVKADMAQPESAYTAESELWDAAAADGLA